MRLYHWMLKSDAWRSLSLPARAVLIELYSLYTGANNGDLFLSARKAATAIGTGKTLAWRALRELRQKGFIRPRQDGSFHWKERHATTWVLSEFEFGDQQPTRDFMRWRPDAEEQNTVRGGGQGVPSHGQMEADSPRNGPICPSTWTDSGISAENLSACADTDSLPGRGTPDGKRGRSAKPPASAARSPR